MNFKNKKVIVMGLGTYKNGSGIASALFLAKNGADVLVTDLRSKKELSEQLKKLKKYKNIKYVLGKHKEEDFKKCDIVVKNPAVPKDSKFIKIAKKHGAKIHNDWSLFLLEKDNFLVGVTGTRGKSTTATLIYEFLKNESLVHLCGNIGVSPLAIFSKIKRGDLVVAELSSWLLNSFKEVRRSPNISVITNLMPDHQDKYKSLKEYYADKKNIFKYQKKDDILILNKDNKETEKLKKEAKSQVFWFSQEPLAKKEKGTFKKGYDVFFQKDGKKEKIANLKNIKLKGRHNIQNILAALCVVCFFDVKKSKIQKILNSFLGVKNRLEFVGKIKGVSFYNDTTATSPDASCAALEALGSGKKNIVLIAGGTDKNLNYNKMAESIKKYAKFVVLFFGSASDKIVKELDKKKFSKSKMEEGVKNMEDAVKKAMLHAKKGDIILLSCGAASFGLFKNEFDRGNKFVKTIKKLKS